MVVISKKVFFIMIVMILSVNLFAGWTQTIGGSNTEYGNSVQQTSDGGYIIAGSTSSFGAGGADVYLIKTNSNGNVIWSNTWGYSGLQTGESVQQTTDGGYIIGGTGMFGDEDLILIKTNSNGDVTWSQTFDPMWNDQGNSVQQTSDGGYILAGLSEISNQNQSAYFVKTSSNGSQTASLVYGGSENDGIYSVKQTTDGGYIGAGYSEDAGDYDAWIVKLTSNLQVSWDVEIDAGSSSDILYSIQQTTDGGYICVGYCYNSGWNGLLLKTNSVGSMTWGWYYGGAAGYENLRSVQQTTDGGYIMVGCTESYGAGGKDVWLVKTDNGGNMIWDQTFGGSDDDAGYSVYQTTDGGYIVAGYTESYGAGGKDVYLIKTNSSGVAVEETVVSSPDNTQVSIYQVENNLSISFSLTQSENVELNLFDISGRLMSTPISGFYTQGYHTITCPMDRKGVYLFTFKSSTFTESGKIIVY